MKFLKFLMFNPFVKLYLYSAPWFIRWNKRVKTMTLEMWYTLGVFFPYLIVFQFIPTILLENTGQKDYGLIDVLTMIPFSILLIGFLNKDFINGQSVVHRLIGFQVIDVKTMQPANRLKCMLRNLTAPLWFIEGILILINPKRRLGDYIAGTMLVDVETSDPELILNEFQNIKFDGQAKLTLLFSILWALALGVIFDPKLGLW